jgi:amino acid transporter/nucleotide-binding universal stress UspA family protein
MDASPPASGGVRVRVSRDLGLFDVAMAAVGAMVGASVFLLLGATFTVAGGWVFVSVAFAAGIAALGGMAYGELASGRPDASGGAYVWVKTALPAPSGFLSGWLSWSGAMAVSAFSALGLSLFLIELVAPASAYFGTPSQVAPWLALGVLAFCASAHLARVHLSARFLGRLNLAKIALIVALGLAGLPAAASSGTSLPGPFPGSLGIVLGAGIFFIAFQGFEIVAQLSDQTKAPERTVPRGMAVAVGLALAVYLLFFFVVLRAVPAAALAGWPACPACRAPSQDVFFSAVSAFAIGQPWIRYALLLLGIVSMYGALNASITSAVRTSISMSQDGLLPSSVGRVGGREIPPVALVAAAVGAGAMTLLFDLETIVILATLAFLGLFAFVHASVVSLRRRERRDVPGFRMPLVPLLPLFAIALNLAVGAVLWNFPAGGAPSLSAGSLATYVGSAWVALGLIYHYVAGGGEAVRKAPTAARRDVTTVLSTTEEPVELERYRVFLPLREFTDTALVDFGARVARARNGELSLLNVVEIPRNLPPKAIRFRFVDERIRGLQRLAKIGEQLGVDTRPVVKIGYKPYEIILDTIREEAVNLLVMGWRGERVEGDRRILGSNIDYLIENAPCDVVVFKTKGLERPLRKLVVLSSPIWSVEGVGELALVLGEEDRPAILVVSLAGDPTEAEKLKQDAVAFLEQAHTLGFQVEQEIVYTRQWESVALQRSAEASILFIRATSPGGLRRYALSPVEDRVAKLAKCPVLIMRVRGG